MALAEAVLDLPWLSPCAASLVALCRAATPEVWSAVRADPGCVLLVLREGRPLPSAPPETTPCRFSLPDLLKDPAVLEGALRFLPEGPAASNSSTRGFVDWTEPALWPVYRACLTYAQVAEQLARQTGHCPAEAAWVGGLLAPLGWLAVGAVDPGQVTACLTHPALAQRAPQVQQRCWGLDQAALARRLARRWRLPAWLAAVVGHLALPVQTAVTLGAELELFEVVQLAVALAEQQGTGLYLPLGARPAELMGRLRLSEAQTTTCLPHGDLPTASARWESPSSLPLLPDLLRLAAANRRQAELLLLERLEQDIDHLQTALEQQRASEAERLQRQKLEALAELAAGAGHEINNPLAVISGQAQYLLGRFADAEGVRGDGEEGQNGAPALPPSLPHRSLQTIVAQAQRIHQILSELMQFARPQRPRKGLLEVGAVIRDVAASLAALADQRRVRLVCPEAEPVSCLADPNQLRTILSSLLRNAIEAAANTTEGEDWAGIRLEPLAPGAAVLELLVEDSGPGPAEADWPHLFDPFYSGRQAGRGRGLGLSTAWRLAREQDGDVRFDPTSRPTRFILRLPRGGSGNGTHVNGLREEPHCADAR
jgi:signal transduction histidine kinase